MDDFEAAKARITPLDECNATHLADVRYVGQMCIHYDDMEGAKIYVDKALEMAPHDKVALQVAASYYSEIEKEKALQLVDRALAVDPLDNDSRALRGHILCGMDQKHWPEAVELFKSVLKRDPKNTQTLKSMGYIYGMWGDEAEALNYYSKLMELDPLDPEAPLGVGSCQLSLGRVKEGIANLELSARMNPSDQAAYIQLANLFMSQEHYGRALVYFEDALEIKTDPETYLSYCTCQFLNNEHDTAIENLKKAKTMFPQNELTPFTEAIFKIADELISKNKDIYRARDFMKLAMNWCPNDPRTLKLQDRVANELKRLNGPDYVDPSLTPKQHGNAGQQPPAPIDETSKRTHEQDLEKKPKSRDGFKIEIMK